MLLNFTLMIRELALRACVYVGPQKHFQKERGGEREIKERERERETIEREKDRETEKLLSFPTQLNCLLFRMG